MGVELTEKNTAMTQCKICKTEHVKLKCELNEKDEIIKKLKLTVEKLEAEKKDLALDNDRLISKNQVLTSVAGGMAGKINDLHSVVFSKRQTKLKFPVKRVKNVKNVSGAPVGKKVKTEVPNPSSETKPDVPLVPKSES